MKAKKYILCIVLGAVCSMEAAPQMPFKLPSFNEALSGHRSAIKIPTPKDLGNFTDDYQSHLGMLTARSEKAHRKAFLKFVAIEDQLLTSLCDSNEFQANMLMRSAMASYGKIEADRQRKSVRQQKPFYQKENALRIAASLSGEVLSSDERKSFENSIAEHRAESVQTGSNLYSAYMTKRVRIYENVFEKEGTKRQRKLLGKLKRKARLWEAFKMEDRNLMARFANKHYGVMKFSKELPGFQSGMAAATPDYSRALAMAENTDMPVGATGGADLMAELKNRFVSEGILSDSEMQTVDDAGKLLTMAREKMGRIDTTAGDPSKRKSQRSEKEMRNETVKAKRFWDRLYGGVDFNWENPTGYYPEGLGLVLTGGYKISNDAGLNLEVNTLFNGSKMGFEDDKRFRSTLVSNYSVGANVDYRLWKFVFVGGGAEAIVNNLEAPAEDYYKKIKNADLTVGVPIILRLIAPISTISGTNVEIRYDLNTKHNIKPNFDFRVGFLIGR